MALLTNADRAVIDARKLADYALNPGNPVGRHKARVFAAVLGFDQSNVHLLIEELRRGVVANTAEPGSVDEYGALLSGRHAGDRTKRDGNAPHGVDL